MQNLAYICTTFNNNKNSNSMKQTSKLSNGGNLMNRLMGNNATTPEVGKFATILHYSDRTVAKVVGVSKDGKTVTLAHCETIPDPTKDNQMGHQNWLHIETSDTFQIVYKWGAWRRAHSQVVFTDAFRRKFQENWLAMDKELKAQPGSFNERGELNVVEGYTRIKVHYSEISVLFGSCSYYYDWSF